MALNLLVALSPSLKRTDAPTNFELHWVTTVFRVLRLILHPSTSGFHIDGRIAVLIEGRNTGRV